MAKQSNEQTTESINRYLGDEPQEKPQVLFSGVTQDELDAWKAKYGTVHIITVRLNDHETLTGYFKKPGRDIMANCINLAQDKKIYEAREFLLLNTWIGGDKTITTNFDASVTAQTKLWTSINFLTADATKY